MKWKIRAFVVVTLLKMYLVHRLWPGLDYRIALFASGASTGLMWGYLETEAEYFRNQRRRSYGTHRR